VPGRFGLPYPPHGLAQSRRPRPLRQRRLAQLHLLDELGLAIVPVLLGAGVPLFRGLFAQKSLRLVEWKPYKSGLVLLPYVRT
jgi:hypothetical protein